MKKESERLTVQNPLGSEILMRGWHTKREIARLAKREAILATLAQYPRLGQGLRAAGLSWPTLVGLMRHKGFKDALWKIRMSQTAAGAIRRRRKSRVAVRWELQRAGLPESEAYTASHQVCDPPKKS